jgi:hypothetical protein
VYNLKIVAGVSKLKMALKEVVNQVARKINCH